MIRTANRIRCLSIVALSLTLVLLLTAVNAAAGPSSAIRQPTSLTSQERNLAFIMMLVYISVAIVFSFLCSVAEAVLLSVSPSYIQKLERDKISGSGRLKKMKRNVDRSLAAILTLNTIAHTIGAGGAGAEAAKAFGSQYVSVAMAVLTLMILFLSEIIPKTIGAIYWRSLAVWTAHFVQALIWILYPLILVSELLTTLLTRGKRLHGFNREEFTALADIGAQAGHLDAKESRILKNLFRFPKLRAADIMTPRTVMFALQQDATVDDILNEYPEISFSRIPIFGENRDDITGFVLQSDLMLNRHRNDGKGKLRDFRRELRAIADSTPLTVVLEELLDNRLHILLVVDMYGGTEGLVTLEDVVETLIGFEIVDEVDKIDDMRKLARQKWEARRDSIGSDVPREGDSATPE